MNFVRIIRLSRLSFYSQFNSKSFLNSHCAHRLISSHSIANLNANHSSGRYNKIIPLTTVAALSFFKKDEEKETPEMKLVNTIKRSILCIQREQYEKAERMLHLALRMAQDMQSKDGITYVFDVMANLAMDRGQFEKAEKLFVDVMRRLFADGHLEDSMQMLHISSKLAHIAQFRGQYEKAVTGFQWTLAKIEEKLKELPNDNEIRELLGLTKNWYAQVLLEQGKFMDAKRELLEAFEIYTALYGKVNAEAVTMLNNLSVACSNMEDFPAAKKFLEEAISLAKQVPNVIEEGVLKANLGMLYLKEGLLQQAKETCSAAWKWGKKENSPTTVEQAEYCLDKINEMTKGT